MNKIVPNEDRVSISMVEPAASGKTRSIFQMLKKETFVPAFENIFYFHQYFQKLYAEMQREVRNTEFIGSLDFEFSENLPNDGLNYLLIFDDSCDEISRSKQFEKIAIAWRHRKHNCIYVKQFVSWKCKWERHWVEKTNMVPFKSPRDVQQIDVQRKPLGLGNTLRKWYADATSIPYGHLMIDLSPKTNDLLRYSTDSFPTKFFSPSSRSRVKLINDQNSGLLYSKALL